MTKPIDPADLTTAHLLKVATRAQARVTRSWMLRMLRWGAGASNLDLMTHLLEELGVRQTRTAVATHGEWLAQNGYLATKTFEKTTVYQLTRRGEDMARGLIVDPEVFPVSLSDLADDDAVIHALRTGFACATE